LSLRCVACDQPLLDFKRRRKETGDFEDMCGPCRSAAFSQYNFVYDHEYVLQDARDGDVSLPLDCSKN